jgi:hypothetical protein
MKPNARVRDEIFQVIKNQIDADDPPETKITYERLISLGYSEFETKQLIGQCVAVEIFDVLKYNKPFNQTRFIRNLKKLPEEPFE